MKGDDTAWGELVRRHTRQVFLLAMRSTRRVDEAEDLCQEVFWKVTKTIHKYDQSCAFKPWLLQVARNHLIDHHRSRRREKESTIELDGLVVEPGQAPPTQTASVLQQERAKAIQEGLALLSEGLREAVTLRDLQDLEYEEISEMLSVPLGTVKSRINRGRIRLAEILREKKEELT